jgi:hypothetical protein
MKYIMIVVRMLQTQIMKFIGGALGGGCIYDIVSNLINPK